MAFVTSSILATSKLNGIKQGCTLCLILFFTLSAIASNLILYPSSFANLISSISIFLIPSTKKPLLIIFVPKPIELKIDILSAAS